MTTFFYWLTLPIQALFVLSIIFFGILAAMFKALHDLFIKAMVFTLNLHDLLTYYGRF